MLRMPIGKGRMKASSGIVETNSHSIMEVGSHFHGFYGWVSKGILTPWCHYGCGRQRKTTHFVVVKSTHTTKYIAHFFIKEILRLQGVPKKIISEWDAKLTSKFWKELFVGLGKKLAFSAIYDPWTDRKIERVNKWG